MESISISKEGATFSSLVAPMVKTEQKKGVFVVDVEGTFPSEPKEKILIPHPGVR